MTLKLCGRARAVTFVVAYAPTGTQQVGGKRSFWTAVNRIIVKDVPKHEHIFVLMSANARTGQRRGVKCGSRECRVPIAYDRDAVVSDF